MASLVCPKCKGEMRAYERNGVTIDQCEECRGIFLDRGELERLMESEAQVSGGPTPPPQAYAQQPPQGYPQPYPPQPGTRGFWETMLGEGHHGRGRYGGHH